jgi:hypothetical protein
LLIFFSLLVLSLDYFYASGKTKQFLLCVKWNLPEQKKGKGKLNYTTKKSFFFVLFVLV